MKQRRTRVVTAIVAGLALLTGSAVLATDSSSSLEVPAAAAEGGDQDAAGGDVDVARSTNCKRAYTFGSGSSTFNWCYSDDGNISTIEHSAGLEHVAVGTITEGWCVSANHVVRGQTNGSSANFGLKTPFYPKPNRVVHRTTDDSLRIEQRFSQQAKSKTIVITMKVRNVTEAPLNNVYLTRFIDPDLSNTTSGDIGIAGSRSVAMSEAGSSRLELIPRYYKFAANSLLFSDFLPTLDEDCYNATADTNDSLTAGDRSMGVHYVLGTIFPGEQKTVKFLYRISI